MAQEEFLREFARRVAGKNGENIVELLIGKTNINELKIAKKLDMTPNQVRSTLYKMFNHGIVSFIHKKDKRKGWYTYFWTLNEKKALEALSKFKRRSIEELQRVSKSREKKRFFLCPRNCVEMSEEAALLHDFCCPECGSLLQPAPTEEKIKEINKRVDTLRNEFRSIEEELAKIREKEEKIREKRRAKKKRKGKAKKKKKRKKRKKKKKRKRVRKKGRKRKKKKKPRKKRKVKKRRKKEVKKKERKKKKPKKGKIKKKIKKARPKRKRKKKRMRKKKKAKR